MRIIDSHFHWWPRSVSERFCKRTAYPRAEVNSKGGYTYMRQKRADYELSSWAEWFDLDKQLEHMDGLGHQVDVVCSIGPFSVFFSELPPEEGREAAIHWNEEMAAAQ
jgi:aminocarboxymuconate-semialdehyde decarboxylase